MPLKSQTQDLHIPRFNVLLTHYDHLRSDFLTLVPFYWQALIVDEGQRIKNNNSKLFQLLNLLSVRFKLILSGTPLQNSFDELYNLLEFLDPQKFNPEYRTRLNLLRTEHLIHVDGKT